MTVAVQSRNFFKDMNKISNETAKIADLSPVLKWVGGKRQLLNDIAPLIPQDITTYIEPFVGGGAVIFHLQPQKAIINDYNEELINVYRVVKEQPQELLALLKKHEELNSSEYFYEVRSLDRDASFASLSNVERAARVIYLNKTCFNGLFRVNRLGYFNTPYGKYKNPNIVNEVGILAMSQFFNENDVTIKQGDYRLALENVAEGSFVYFDPPYMPISESSAFTSYTENGFDTEQQIALKEECDKLHAQGIRFLLSNSDHPFLRELYKDYEIITVSAKRFINSKADKRGAINEILVRNYS